MLSCFFPQPKEKKEDERTRNREPSTQSDGQNGYVVLLPQYRGVQDNLRVMIVRVVPAYPWL